MKKLISFFCIVLLLTSFCMPVALADLMARANQSLFSVEFDTVQADLKSIQLMETDDGEPCVVLGLQWSHTEDYGTAFLFNLFVSVSQNGIDCDSTHDVENIDTLSIGRKIRPHVRYDIFECYVLQNTQDPIKVEIKESFALGGTTYSFMYSPATDKLTPIVGTAGQPAFSDEPEPTATSKSAASAELEEISASGFVFDNGLAFGMTKKQVIRIMGAEPTYQTTDCAVYSEMQYAERPCTFFYFFNDSDSLNNISLEFEDWEGSALTAQVTHYEAMEDYLISRYGVPEVENTLFPEEGDYKEADALWILDVLTGDSTLLSIWSNDGMLIYHHASQHEDEKNMIAERLWFTLED